MRDAELFRWTLTAATDAIAAGPITARALAESELARIAATDAAIGAWAHLDPLRVRALDFVCDDRYVVTLGQFFGIGIAV